MKNYIRSSHMFVTVFDFSRIASALGANVLSVADRFLSKVAVALITRVELAPIPLKG